MATASSQGAGLARVPVRTLGIALVAALVTLFFFSPSFMSWRGLGTTYLWGIPECGRAKAALQQIDDPWAPVVIDLHRVIAWRLLFPVTWHYLHLPRWLFLAMPYVGCLLTLWLAARILQPRLQDWTYTALAVLVFAALPWFFVSTEWLAYFDSWLVLGLLTVALVRSRWAVGLACLLVPWIDERILLALPVCLAIRAIDLPRANSARHKEFLRDVGIVVAASAPYLIIRAIAWLHGDVLPGEYLAAHCTKIQTVPWTRLLEGLWSGYRAAWVFVLGGVWFCGRRLGRAWGVTLGAVIAMTALGGLLMASDMSRSLMMICPAVLLGIWLWHDARPRSFRWMLPAVAAANLLLPAAHVMWDMKIPIFYLHTELFHYFEQPMQFFDADLYAFKGEKAFKEERWAEAQSALDTAIELDDRCAVAYLYRSALRIKQNNLEGALHDAEALLALEKNSPDSLYLRAAVKKRQGDLPTARADVQQALLTAPAGWTRRGEAQKLLDSLAPQSALPPIP